MQGHEPWTGVLLTVVLAGCASVPEDRGLAEVRSAATQRGAPDAPEGGPRDCADPAAGIAPLLADVLTAETAVRIALLCNPALAAEYARLGIARAEAFRAGRLANPTFTVSALDSSAEGAAAQLGVGIVQSFTSLILRGPRQRLAEGELLRTEQLLAGSILMLAAQVKSAYYGVIGAEQAAMLRNEAATAAHTSADLAMSFHAAGNMAARELALEQAAAAQADGEVRVARNTALAARAELQRLLGIAPDLTWRVPETLPLPVAEEDAPAAVQAMAGEQRLDLAASRGLVELLAANTRDTEKYRWLGTLDVGVAYEREADRSRLLGPTLSVQLPLFGGGKGNVAHAQALQDWSEAEQRRLTTEVADAVDLASRRVMSAREQVEGYRTGLIPQREAVVARTQEEVNFMLRGVFDLIAVKRQEYDAYESYVQVLRDYWIARCELELAVGARLPSEADVASARVGANTLIVPAAASEGDQP